eukprot:UN08617
MEQLIKPNVPMVDPNDPDHDLKVNSILLQRQTTLMPYSNNVAKNVLKNKLKILPHILNSQAKRIHGIEEGSKLANDPNYINQHKYQQLLQSFDDTATYTTKLE